jgi:hypothetical protein
MNRYTAEPVYTGVWGVRDNQVRQWAVAPSLSADRAQELSDRMNQMADARVSVPIETAGSSVSREILVSILSAMQDEMEEIRERELAQLPVQPFATPICPHCVEQDLRRARN